MNIQNYFLVMNKYQNLKELSVSSLKQITEILGLENGTKLYSFFQTKLEN